jgi:hypothetical protein
MYLYNKQWFCSEMLELLGISILDVSLIEMEEIYVFIAEITGFIILCCAAGLHFEYNYHETSGNNEVRSLENSNSGSDLPISLFSTFPSLVTLRLDMVHSSECVGLIMLMIVAYGQFRIKVAKHEHQQQQEQYHSRYSDSFISMSNLTTPKKVLQL